MKESNYDLEKWRVTQGVAKSDSSYGMTGMFFIPRRGKILKVISSDGDGWEADPPVWEHVSVSPDREKRTPTWDEMEFIRDIFWEEDELVLQFSVPRAKHINIHPYVLHLWRPQGVEIPLPPALCV